MSLGSSSRGLLQVFMTSYGSSRGLLQDFMTSSRGCCVRRLSGSHEERFSASEATDGRPEATGEKRKSKDRAARPPECPSDGGEPPRRGAEAKRRAARTVT